MVIRSPNWLGDAIMSLPAIRALRNRLGKKASLTVATPAHLADMWLACSEVNHVMALPKPRNLFAVASVLRKGSFGSLLLLPNSFRTAMEGILAKIPHRIGYTGHWRQRLLSHPLEPRPYDPLHPHHHEFYLHLVRTFFSQGSTPLASSPTSEADEIFSSLPLLAKPLAPYSEKKNNLLALCPGAAYGPAKQWPEPYFIEVAQALQKQRNAHIILLGSAQDRPLAEKIASALPAATNYVGKTSLQQLMGIFSQTRVVLANDSGAMHLASALGTPVVALFGSTEPQRTGPLGDSHRIRLHRHHVPCSPCFLRHCPLNFSCMLKLTPQEITASCLELWDTFPIPSRS